MAQLRFVIDLYPIYTTFRHRLEEKIRDRLTPKTSVEMVTDDFFDICLHLASDAVKFFDAGEQRLMLNPVGRVRQMVNTQMQDIFFDQLSEYAHESKYFTIKSLDEHFVGNDVASLGVYIIDEILREIMGALIQYPEGRMYFDSTSYATNDDAISDLIMNRCTQNAHDMHVFLGFE
jgi:hypothetical protein